MRVNGVMWSLFGLYLLNLREEQVSVSNEHSSMRNYYSRMSVFYFGLLRISLIECLGIYEAWVPTTHIVLCTHATGSTIRMIGGVLYGVK